MTDTALQVRESTGAITEYSAKEVERQALLIQQVMKTVMHKDEHYGTIPGTNKPTLYKSGAEKLCLTFRLSPAYRVEQTDLPGDHREYKVVCTMTHIPSGQVFGEGMGMGTTMEKKYRYRRDGRENENIADTFNTVLKMAKKRAMVDAVLTCTAASDIFTQDLEDLMESAGKEPGPSPAARPAQSAPDAKAAAPASRQSGDKPQCPKCSTSESVIPDKYAKNLADGVTAWIHYQGPKTNPGTWKGCGHKWTVDGKPQQGATHGKPTPLERAWAVLDEGALVGKEEVEKRWNDGTILPYWEHLSPEEQAELQAHHDQLVA